MGNNNSSSSSAVSDKEEALKSRFLSLKDSEAGITKALFIKSLELPLPEGCSQERLKGELSTRWIRKHGDDLHGEVLSFEQFSLLVNDVKTNTAAEFMFSLFADEEGQITVDDAIAMFNIARLHFLARFPEACAVEVLDNSDAASALGRGLFSHKESMDADTFVHWTSKNTLHVFESVYAWISSHIEETEQPTTPLEVLTLYHEGSESVRIDINTAWKVSSSIPAVFSSAHCWSLIYSSDKDGLSGTSFVHNVSKYSGPLLLNVILDDGQHYVVAMDQGFRDQQVVFGGFDARIVRVAPVFLTYDNVKGFVNFKQRHADHGMGFGDDPKTQATAKLWFSPSLDEVTTKLTHNHAGVPTTARVNAIEVWGCASNDEVTKMKERQRRDQLACEQRQMAQRPTSTEWHDSADRQLLKMAGTLTIDEQSRVSTRKEDM